MLEAIAAEHRTPLRGTEGQRGLLATLRTGGQRFVFHKACSQARARAAVGGTLDLAILATPRVVDQVLERKEFLFPGGEHKFLATFNAG